MAKLVLNLNGGTSDERGLSALFDQTFPSDVAKGLKVVPTGAAGLSVNIETGTAKIPSGKDYAYVIQNTDVENVTLGAASASSARIDTIVAYIDKAVTPQHGTPNNPQDILKFAAVAGTAGGGAPTASAIQNAVSSNPYIILADVTVPQNALSIAASNIIDRRQMIKSYVEIAAMTDFNAPEFLKPRVWCVNSIAAMNSTANKPNGASAGFGETKSITGLGAMAGYPNSSSTQTWTNYNGTGKWTRLISANGSGVLSFGSWVNDSDMGVSQIYAENTGAGIVAPTSTDIVVDFNSVIQASKISVIDKKFKVSESGFYSISANVTCIDVSATYKIELKTTTAGGVNKAYSQSWLALTASAGGNIQQSVNISDVVYLQADSVFWVNLVVSGSTSRYGSGATGTTYIAAAKVA